MNRVFSLKILFFNEKELTDIMNILNTITFNNKEDFGSDNGVLEFPTSYSILNHLTLHPKIIKYCKTLLNTSDIRLIQSDFWNKTNNGKTHMDSNSDQRMHMDYPNNYLTHPNNWRNPDSIAIIIYFSDHLECGGETSVVPRLSDKDYLYKPPYTNNIGLGNYKWANDKYSVEKYFKENYPDVYHFRKKLYEREIKVPYKKGSILFYRHDLWHRGTPIKNGKNRIVMNLGFKKAGCDYITCWNKGFARHLCDKTNYLEELISKLNEEQKKCLGFPPINSSYWNTIQKKAFDFRYSKL